MLYEFIWSLGYESFNAVIREGINVDPGESS